MKRLFVVVCGLFLVQPQMAAAERSGKEIYDKHCFVCHASGIAGAPKFGEEGAWDERLKKGMDELVASNKKGLNAMPPMGTCMDCTDGEIKATIEYMVEHSKKK